MTPMEPRKQQRGLIRRPSGEVVVIQAYLRPDVARALKLHALDV